VSIRLYLAPGAAGKPAYAPARQDAKELRGCVHVCVTNQLQRRSWRERLAEAGGALGVRVQTFGQLYRECLRAVEAAVAGLDDPVQRRLLRATMNRVPLAHYRPIRENPGFPLLLHGLVAELKVAGVALVQEELPAQGAELRLPRA
jgi:hypothetical protein